MDDTDVRSFRPISNLPVVSKLIERLVAKRLINYLTTNDRLPKSQSAYRSHHSTETAVAKVLSDIPLALDEGAWSSMPAVTGPFRHIWHRWSWSTVANTSHRLTYGVNGVAHDWFRSYLIGRHQYVRVRASHSSTVFTQGSVLGPIWFLLYTADIAALVGSHGSHVHLYADDTQVPVYIWILFTVVNWSITVKHVGLHWRCCWLDGVKYALVKRLKNRDHVVLVSTSSESATHFRGSCV